MSTDKPIRGRDIINNPDRFIRESNKRTPSVKTKSISITVASPSNYSDLTNAPDGVTISTPQPSQKKSLGPVDEFTIKLILNVGAEVKDITYPILIAWLVNKLGSDLRSVSGNRELDLDRIPEDKSSVIDAIVRKIESQKHEN